MKDNKEIQKEKMCKSAMKSVKMGELFAKVSGTLIGIILVYLLYCI